MPQRSIDSDKGLPYRWYRSAGLEPSFASGRFSDSRPLAETSLRNALLSSGGDASILVASPITWVLYGLMAAVLIFTVWRRLRQRKSVDV
ncbi:hypothetical protein [Citricoccus muralis]|uniref:hypothetical protein n=1 Tax=Citricoccus muralis TaxID=169134 RepID=UPI003D6B32E8